jgi:hypothetical protein
MLLYEIRIGSHFDASVTETLASGWTKVQSNYVP